SIDVVSSFSKGRVDLVVEDTKIGATVRGDFSVLDDKTRDATVVHADGTGVHLRPDGTIDRWGPAAKDNASGEKLSAGEAEYYKKHPEIDEREFAEIHRRFEGNADKLDKFYGELEKLESARHLTPQEKAAIRQDVMHHVANPSEIYQG